MNDEERTRLYFELAAADQGKRLALAANPETPSDWLSILAAVGDEQVRWTVAGNENCSVEVLDRLAGDTSVYVRVEVAGNPVCSAGVLRKVVEPSIGIHPSVFVAAAGNPNCPSSGMRDEWMREASELDRKLFPESWVDDSDKEGC